MKTGKRMADTGLLASGASADSGGRRRGAELPTSNFQRPTSKGGGLVRIEYRWQVGDVWQRGHTVAPGTERARAEALFQRRNPQVEVVQAP